MFMMLGDTFVVIILLDFLPEVEANDVMIAMTPEYKVTLSEVHHGVFTLSSLLHCFVS